MNTNGGSQRRELESAFFGVVNSVVEPAVRLGFGSPGILPTGLIVLETTGWRTGRRHRTPVLASVVGEYLLASTVRGRRSRWVENLRRSPDVRYWRHGVPRRARAIVFAPGVKTPDLSDLPPLARAIGAGLVCFVEDLGCAFALLGPAGRD